MTKPSKHYKADLKVETIRKAKLEAYKEVLDFAKAMGVFSKVQIYKQELESYLKDKIIDQI